MSLVQSDFEPWERPNMYSPQFDPNLLFWTASVKRVHQQKTTRFLATLICFISFKYSNKSRMTIRPKLQ